MSLRPPQVLRELRHTLFTLRQLRSIPRRPFRAPIVSQAPLTPRLYSTASPSDGRSTHSSVDPSEVTHFNALASSWWDPHGPSRLLHLMNPLRHDFISRCRSTVPNAAHTLPYTPSPSSNAKLDYLDIGCGGGIFAESAARLPTTQSVTAIDPSSDVLAVARRHARRDPLLQEPGRLTYLETPVEDLSDALGDAGRDRGARFDVVSVFEVLEHVAYPAPFLEQVVRFVKPGAWLVGSTIARTWASWLTTKVVAEDLVGIVPRGTHDWEKYVNPDELREWFRKQEGWGEVVVMEVLYVPGLGWKEVKGFEGVGNYFFGVRKNE